MEIPAYRHRNLFLPRQQTPVTGGLVFQEFLGMGTHSSVFTRSAFVSVCGAILVCAGATQAFAQKPVRPVANACVRPAAGSVVRNPPSLFSQNGALDVNFSYQTTTDADGRTLFCFMTPAGQENPTLHVRPGDHLRLKVTNNTPASAVSP